MKVGLFIPCLVEQFDPDVGVATAEVLAGAGAEIRFPKDQTCCGQPVYKSGYRKQTKKVARHFIEVFEDYEAIVAPSGSCISMVRNYYTDVFKDEPAWYDRSVEIGKRCYELTEFLVNVMGVEDLGATLDGKAVYHDSCQVYRALGVYKEPRALLSKVRNLEVLEMERPDLCCGFGGNFSLQFHAISDAMVEQKVGFMLDTGAGYVISAEISCLMNIGGYIRKKRLPLQAVHIAQVLNHR